MDLSYEIHEGWYVIYTKPRHEKKISYELNKSMVTYLPLIKSLRRWSDRKKMVELPLFTSYVFIYLRDLYDYDLTLRTRGVYNFLKNSNRLVQVPILDIKKIKYLLGEFDDVKAINSHPDIRIGESRIINFGLLAGTECEIVRYDGKQKAIVKIESIQQTLLVEIDTDHLESSLNHLP